MGDQDLISKQETDLDRMAVAEVVMKVVYEDKHDIHQVNVQIIKNRFGPPMQEHGFVLGGRKEYRENDSGGKRPSS